MPLAQKKSNEPLNRRPFDFNHWFDAQRTDIHARTDAALEWRLSTGATESRGWRKGKFHTILHG